MSILVYRDQAAASAAAATLIAAQIIEKPDSVLGLSAGSMLEGTYARLCGMTGSGILDWSDIRAFHLSEFVGFRADQTKSLGGTLSKCLYDKINIRRENIFMPQSCQEDLALACTQYEEMLLNEGGMDVAFLMLGPDGSVAFNQPGQEFIPLTHVPTLSQSEMDEYIGYFSDRPASCIPKAITMGMGTIMSASKLIVLALGAAVADAARDMINGNVSSILPASVFQLHKNVIYILDEPAALKL